MEAWRTRLHALGQAHTLFPYPLMSCALPFSQARAPWPFCMFSRVSHVSLTPAECPSHSPPSAQSLDGSIRLLHLSVADHVRREGWGRWQQQGVAAHEQEWQGNASTAYAAAQSGCCVCSVRPGLRRTEEFTE